MIQTKQFELTSKQFFKLLVQNHIATKWWLYMAYSVAISTLFLKPNIELIDILFIIFLFAAIIAQFVFMWYHASSKLNKKFLLKRSYSINNVAVTSEVEDGTQSELELQHVIKAKSMREHFLLFVTKNQFIFIPKNSFKSEEDLKWFEQEIVGRFKK